MQNTPPDKQKQLSLFCVFKPLSQTHISLPDGAIAPLTVRINPRAQRILMRIDPVTRGAIVVSPNKRAIKNAVAFAHAQGEWIQNRLAALPEVRPFVDGSVIRFRGEDLLLVRTPTRSRPLLGDRTLTVGCHADDFEGRIKRALVSYAREDLVRSVATYTRKVGVVAKAISVKDTRRRWGSCSTRGDLNFSWRLVAAPPFVLDYVAAHEVCHLREMNHGAAFWALVNEHYGDHRPARDWLKAHGTALHALGR